MLGVHRPSDIHRSLLYVPLKGSTDGEQEKKKIGSSGSTEVGGDERRGRGTAMSAMYKC